VCDFGYLDSPLSECNQARIRLLILVKVIFQICSVGRGLVRIFSSMQAEEGKISRLYPVIVSAESLPICYLGLQNRQKIFYCFWRCCGKSVINLSPESGSIDSELRIRLKDLKKFKKKVHYFNFKFLLSFCLTTCMLFN